MLKKYFPHCKYEKKQQSEIKPIKTGKQPGTTYCLGSKDFKLCEKLNCVFSRSNKSRFLKQKII